MSAERGELTLTIRDDGHGFDAGERAKTAGGGYGLRNMRVRAEELGGVCTLARAEPGSTVLTWRVPL